jgi:type IV pilus assembly protein PilB
MVLVTGPTGSGKTTTLDAALSEIKSPEDKIITIEDPVEHCGRHHADPDQREEGPDVCAVAVDPEARSRQDHGWRDPRLGDGADRHQLGPDRTLGVHDRARQQCAGRVSGASSNMGVEATSSFQLSTALAQRLVRTICHHCRRQAKVSAALFEESGLDPALERTHTFYEGHGCIECGGTGHKGRTAICELLDLSDHIREMILEKRPTSKSRRPHARKGCGSCASRRSNV